MARIYGLPALLVVFLLIVPAPVQCSNDLLDLSCNHDEDCHNFSVQSMGILSRCLDRQCLCSNGSSTLSMPCVPMEIVTSNLVGGPCPCKITYTSCSNDRCFCSPNFTPSPDKRRCLPNFIRVGKFCEMNSQCSRHSVFSVCNSTSRQCECLPNHELLPNDQCQGLVALDHHCTSDTDCASRIAHSICVHNKCMCEPEFVARPDNTECLVNANAFEACLTDMQCRHKLGPGGVCRMDATNATGSCACNQLDTVMAVIRTGNRTQYLCENRKVIGDPCANNADCHQFTPENASDLPQLECFLTECICSAANGYEQASSSDRYCVRKSGSAANAVASSCSMAVIMSLVMLLDRFAVC